MNLSPIVNTDIKMSVKMLEALILHETRCVVTGVTNVTDQSVREFLSDRYGDALAKKFEPRFLFSNQDF